MNAKIPAPDTANGWLLYDGDCALCRGAARRFENLLNGHGFNLTPLQTPWARERFHLAEGERPEEMILLLPDDREFGGADAYVQIARRIWWAWPFYAFSHIPGVMLLLRAVYRRIAANRYCYDGACRLPKQNHLMDFLPLTVLPIATLFVRDVLPAWTFMWLLAFAMFFGCKWLTLSRAMRQFPGSNRVLTGAYFFAWVGMDAKNFLNRDQTVAAPAHGEWLSAFARSIIGIALIWFVAPMFVQTRPMLAGWLGMFGFILCLHFGTFQLLSLAWRRAGINAQPIMQKPLLATSLSEFWGQRWNGGFHFLANTFLFRPLLRRCGAAVATLLVFLVSGVIHDLLISLPARGGYGLPTAYFAIQGCGIFIERSALGRTLGLGHGWRGWVFAAVCAGAPAFWLFHPIFIHNVILPMLHAIGGT